MPQIFYSLLARLLPTPTVDRAVAALTKAAKALAAAEAAELAAAEKIDLKISQLTADRSQKIATAARAGRVASRLTDITA